MKYIHIIRFLMNHDLTHLKECWLIELTGGRKPSIYRVLKSYLKTRSLQKYILFWWRLANEMYMHGNDDQRQVAKKIQQNLILKFHIEIMFGARIGKSPFFTHPYSITINDNVTIGDRCTILQNVTIGLACKPIDIVIGNDVHIGANSVILGGKINIGNNVNIGAMSFINKDIPDNCTVYTKKTNTIIRNN